jgi:hypothetical protein
MRFELNRSSRLRPLSFNLNAFQNLRNLTQQPNHIITPTASSLEDIYNDNNIQHPTTATTTTATTTTTTNNNNNTNEISTTAACHNDNNVDECCICLYALAPFQALFVSPCSHTYHFKCIRPLLQSYPGFQCPICRTYSDLEASVAMEEAEEYTTNSHERSNTISITTAPPADSRLSLQSTGSDLIMASASPLSVSPEALEPIPFEASVPEAILEEQDHNSISPVSPVICSENLPDNTPIDVNNSMYSLLATSCMYHICN